jgi:hypothetical protein
LEFLAFGRFRILSIHVRTSYVDISVAIAITNLIYKVAFWKSEASREDRISAEKDCTGNVSRKPVQSRTDKLSLKSLSVCGVRNFHCA